ncbi:MAG: PIG-L family deacetylase [Bryobacteraceae bacterium]|nr:PIG-L family deacetylase [Bryobacteraceae bacterium]
MKKSVIRKRSLGAAPFNRADIGGIIIDKDQPGQPHKGKVFAAIHAHLDDIPFYAAGLCAKLIGEGYTGYVLRTSNDEKRGGGTPAQNILSNEQEHIKMAEAVGFKEVFDLYYQNHEMDGISSLDLRGRIIFILRLIKADTVISFNPWGHGEENPDHWATGRAVEEAAWMCGIDTDFHEHLEAGIQPHPVLERYYFQARRGQPYNRVVDIGSHIEKKIASLVECKSQGGGNFGSQLRARLAKEGKRLPLLGNDDRTADREYVRQFLLEDEREAGREFGLEFAERFYYIDQRPPAKSKVDEYVERNAVPL